VTVTTSSCVLSGIGDASGVLLLSEGESSRGVWPLENQQQQLAHRRHCPYLDDSVLEQMSGGVPRCDRGTAMTAVVSVTTTGAAVRPLRTRFLLAATPPLPLHGH
jgi:hypothetical protein